MKINGENITETFTSMEELLLARGYNVKYVAVECNGRILPKTKYSTYIPDAGDVIEIVSFVGGG